MQLKEIILYGKKIKFGLQKVSDVIILEITVFQTLKPSKMFLPLLHIVHILKHSETLAK